MTRRATSSITGQILLALIPLGLTLFVLILKQGQEQTPNTLVALLVAEVLAVAILGWRLSLPIPLAAPAPILLPKTRPTEILPEIHASPPTLGEPYPYRAATPARPRPRPSDLLPPLPRLPAKKLGAPNLPELLAPQAGRSNARTPEAAPRPSKPTANRMVMRLDDLLPPTPTPPTSKPQATPRPKALPQNRPTVPAKYLSLIAQNTSLPEVIPLTNLPLCQDVLSLGYLCAASDGPVSSEEDAHVLGWMWSVIEKSADADAAAFLQELSATADQARMRGKQKLGNIKQLAERVRATGERKIIQSAGVLCRAIVEMDGRLEPGEFATLSAALDGLGIRNLKASKIAHTLIANDTEITALLEELEIEDDTLVEERERKLSTAWSLENARMHVVTAPEKRNQMRQRMSLIQKIRDLYREMEQHGP